MDGALDIAEREHLYPEEHEFTHLRPANGDAGPRGRPRPIATIRKSAREDVVVSLSRFAGHDLVDVRIHADVDDRGGDRSATRKGVALAVARLPELRAALQDAEREARCLGLLPIDGGAA